MASRVRRTCYLPIYGIVEFVSRSAAAREELTRSVSSRNFEPIVHPPEDGPWAPGYYSVLFEDPDGIRLEVNFVPGKGLLATPAKTS
jgi:hypothetical protein